MNVLQERENQVAKTTGTVVPLDCEKISAPGSVSQRACVFCGSRVVLYPIPDAVHLVHGPIGCAAYTWDIRGSLSSGPQLHRLSFSTDLREKDVIFGGEKKLERALGELIETHAPNAAFVYSTCIVGLIGDDVEAVCKIVSKKYSIPVIPVHSEGFKGSKKDGYLAACHALMQLIGTDSTATGESTSINILGEFNLAGEAWILKSMYERIGVRVVCVMTGDSRIEEIRRAHTASLNVVQCAGSMTKLAQMMKEKYGIPFIKVSYFGIEDMADALYDVAKFFVDRPQILEDSRALVRTQIGALMPQLSKYKKALTGKRAAVYVGGGFKAFSLVKALRVLGMQTVLVGCQTGNKDDYRKLQEICDEGTIVVDDSNPVELSKFLLEKNADLLIGGVKERPMAYKLGIGFCDHNHERKKPLAGFEGMRIFAEEVYASVMSPVWQFSPRREGGAS